jgi:hypothetical protein
MRTTAIHRYYIKASNLFFISIGLDLLQIFFYSEPVTKVNSDLFKYFVLFLTGSFYIGLVVVPAYFARLGHRWVKYLMTGIILLTILGIPGDTDKWKGNPIYYLLEYFSLSIAIWATILLYLIPKKIYSPEKDTVSG